MIRNHIFNKNYVLICWILKVFLYNHFWQNFWKYKSIKINTNMKEFWLYWSVFFLFLFFFCITTHLLLFCSIFYIPLFLISLVWVIEMLIFSIFFVEKLDNTEADKISRRLFSDGVLLLIIGMIVAFKTKNMEDSDILMIITAFCFCSAVLSMFFGSIIKNKKLHGGTINKNWACKLDTVLVF